MANVTDEEVREFLSDVPVAQTRTLLHLLACKKCRAYAEAVLGEQLAADEGKAPPWRDYNRAFAVMELRTPGLIRRLQAQRSEAEHLLADFLSRTGRARWSATRSRRFHHLGLVDLLLESSHEMQLKEPLQASVLARLANALVNEMAPEKVTDGDAYRVHAYSLAGNALRLAGRLKAAAVALREASSRLRDAANSYERGILCRFLGVLRWEQELTSEAWPFSIMRRCASGRVAQGTRSPPAGRSRVCCCSTTGRRRALGPICDSLCAGSTRRCSPASP
jgi:hypothetical protein